MVTPMSVVFCVTSRSWGGNEKWVAEAARGLAGRGHAVTALWSYEPVLRGIEARGVPARRIRLWGDLNPLGLASLVAAFRRARADAVVLTKQREYWMGGLAAHLAGRPLVVLRLGTRRPQRNDLKRRLAFGRFADRIVVNSSAIREMLAGTPWIDTSRVSVLLNGVSLEPVDPAAGRRSLAALGVPPGRPVVCGAGRLTRMKGFDVLIRAFPKVLASHPDAVLVLLGGGGQLPGLAKEAADAGVRERVIFAGHRDDVREILSAVDVYALSSRKEGMANTLLEAMSVGAPIVATDVSGTLEAVRDGAEALVVPPEDPGALARGVCRLLSDRREAESLGVAALARARERFGYDGMARELESIIAEGVEARASR